MNEFAELINALKKRRHECGWFQLEPSPCNKGKNNTQFMYLNYPTFRHIENRYSLRY